MAIYEERIDDPVASFYPKTATAPTVQDESDFNAWRFVERYYPKYHSSDEIAEADDLQKILDDEAEDGSDAQERYDEEYAEMENFWGDETDPEDLKRSTMEKIQADYNELHVHIYERAIEAFLEQQPKPVIITVKNGKARFSQKPMGIEVVLIDNDMEPAKVSTMRAGEATA